MGPFRWLSDRRYLKRKEAERAEYGAGRLTGFGELVPLMATQAGLPAAMFMARDKVLEIEDFGLSDTKIQVPWTEVNDYEWIDDSLVLNLANGYTCVITGENRTEWPEVLGAMGVQERSR